MRRENEILNARVRALAGLEPAENPRTTEVQQAFRQMFPQLAPLLDQPDHLGQLLEFVKAGGLKQFDSMRETYYGRHASDLARQATAQWAETIGKPVKDLPDGTFETIAANLQVFLQQDQTGERFQRFQYGDPQVMHEFIGRMRSLFVDPVRATQAVAAAQAVATNQALPRQGPAGAPGGSGEPPKKLGKAALREAARQFMLTGKHAAP